MQSADTRRPSGEEAHPAHGEPRVHPIFFRGSLVGSGRMEPPDGRKPVMTAGVAAVSYPSSRCWVGTPLLPSLSFQEEDEIR